jgi:hypothetical protein
MPFILQADGDLGKHTTYHHRGSHGQNNITCNAINMRYIIHYNLSNIYMSFYSSHCSGEDRARIESWYVFLIT